MKSFTYDNHYGAIISHTKSVETNNPYGYTGREIDTPDLYYYRARYYDPTIERFLFEDPIGFDGRDFNWYRYVANNPVNLVDSWGLVSSNIIWKNRPFIFHYFFGGGRPMNIDPNSELGQKILNHLSGIIDKKYKEAISHSCENYKNTSLDPIDFTNVPDLFLLGNSYLKTMVICGNGKCLIRFEINDWFIDARDIHNSMQGNQEYPFGVSYQINFAKVYIYGF